MYVYLNKKYIYEDVVVAIEISKFTSIDDIEYEVIHSTNFLKYKKLVEESSSDFKISDSGEILVNHYVRSINLVNLSMLPKEGEKNLEFINSLYDLLHDLAQESCIYCDKIENLVDEYKGYLPSFSSLRVSNSTMTIAISVRDEVNDNWYSRKIVGVDEEGQLCQYPFYAIIPDESCYKFNKYNMEFIRDLKLNNVCFKIFKYNCNLSACNTASPYIFCEPIISHFCRVEHFMKSICDSINYYLKVSGLKTQDIQPTREIISRSTPRDGVFFKLLKTPRVSDITSVTFTHCKYLASVAKENNIDEVSVETIAEYCNESGLPLVYLYTIAVLLPIMISGNKVAYDVLDNAGKALKSYRLEYLNASLFLYNIRVSCFYNPEIMGFLNVHKFEIAGSIYEDSKVSVTIL